MPSRLLQVKNGWDDGKKHGMNERTLNKSFGK